jgi:thioredoxin-related protein
MKKLMHYTSETCKKCTNAKENAKVNERNPEYFKNKYSDNSVARKAYASKQYEAIKLKKLLEAQALAQVPVIETYEN